MQCRIVKRTPAALRTAPVVVASVALWAAGCALPKAQSIGESCSIQPGELVISEIMANPEGDDAGSEWVELYNASGKPLVLNRLIVAVGPASAGDSFELLGAGTLAAQGYFVIGGGPRANDASTGVADYAHPLGLSNSESEVSLVCHGILIDSVRYGADANVPEPMSGRSFSFDGGLVPDASLNDERGYWCLADSSSSSPSSSASYPSSSDATDDDATEDNATYDGVNRGSPGSPNAPCGFAACYASSNLREVQAPVAGDLVISEVNAEPEDGPEWVEIFVAADHAVDLNGLMIEVTGEGGASKTFPTSSLECLTVASGDYVIVAPSSDPGAADSVLPNVPVAELSLPNARPLLIRLWRGAMLLDEALVPASPDRGVAVRLDEARLSSDANDEQDAFCPAASIQTSPLSGVGTPGAPNGLCGLYSCRDNGVVRLVATPSPGDLLVTELFAKPKLSPAGGRDWLEAFVAGAANVDLNRTTLTVTADGSGSTKRYVLQSEECLTVAPGSYVVIGASGDTAVNGAIHPTAVVPRLQLANDQALLVSLSVDDATIDEAHVPRAAVGAAASLDAAFVTPAGNDDATYEHFCTSTATGFFAEKGTPGAPNGACNSGTRAPR